MQILVKLARLR